MAKSTTTPATDPALEADDGVDDGVVTAIAGELDAEPAEDVPVEVAPVEVGGYPLGVLVGVGVTETVVGDLGAFTVDPETGRITGPA